jgi:NUMOD4 motif/NUMOD1 domain
MKVRIPPYQNTSLTNINGEKWKDIPMLEGYFLISNYGRVKRLEYEMQYRNGAVYTKPEMIIKPFVIKAKNILIQDFTRFLVNRVTLDGARYNITIARMVYYCFVKKFDLQSKEINILSKDGDGLNMHPGNLMMASLSDKAKRIVARKRMVSPFKNLSPANRKKQRAAIAASLNKQVSQYSLQGKKIKTFASAAAAERSTGVYATAIGEIASGGGISAGGYVWKWGDQKYVDINSVRQARKTGRRKKYGCKVTQYDFKGNKIASFPSLQDAQAAMGAHATAIRLVLTGEYKSAKGYYWKKGFGPTKIDLSRYAFGKASMAITQSKKVKQLSLKRKLVKTYPSVKAAAAAIGVTPSVIIDCCKGRQKTSRNYQWQYAK